eukprot:Skav208943  [mRNA]  locus=scaffold1880:173413:178702:+ [translate_table: standard]
MPCYGAIPCDKFQGDIVRRLLPYASVVPMSAFAFLLGSRVGEATNPGPPSHECQELTTFAVCNPTALLGKIPLLHRFPADVILCSETSVTPLASNAIVKEAAVFKFKCFFSQFVKAKLCNISDKPSLRGAAAGAAILSKLPCRRFRTEPAAELWDTCRIAFSVIRVNNFEILVIAVYGFVHDRPIENARLNDLLLANAAQIALASGMPYVIGGDFNCRVVDLPSYRVLAREGAHEAFSFAQSKFGLDLPPTCKNATRHDSCILHPFLAQAVVHMHVDSELAFEPHSPLFVSFDFKHKVEQLPRWSVPRSWESMGIQSDILQDSYQSVQHEIQLPQHADTVDEGCLLLERWSCTVEKAVDKTLRVQHRLDPIRNPYHDLPPQCKGRCKSNRPRVVSHPHTVPADRNDGYNPPDETFRLTNFNKVKQCRRLRSLLKSYEKSFRIDSACFPFPAAQFRHQFFGEWCAIRNAKGYGRAWCRWLLSFEVITFVSSDLPSFEDLQLYADLTIVDCDASCRQEALNRANVKKFLLQVDVKEGFLSSTYRMVKGKPSPKLDEVPMVFKARARLCRIMPGHPIQLQLETQCDFLVQQHAFFGEAKIYIISQSRDNVCIRLIEGVMPSSGDLVQERVSTSAQEVFCEFAKFWSPFWNRDEIDEQLDPEPWSDLLDLIEQTPLPLMQVDVILSDPMIWKKTIDKLSAGKAEGICGWRLPIRYVLNRMGLSWDVLQFWKQCLRRLSRVPVISNSVGPSLSSTTGLPEGDSWSVLDNWSWYTSDERLNFATWQSLLNLMQLLRMKIDFKKCWVWGSTRAVRNQLESINLLFPDGLISLEVKYGVRDLGEIIQYSLKKFSKPLIERIQDTTQRLSRLEWIQIPFADKAKVVLSGIWAHGLYGAELHFLGAQHFKTLRRAACRVFAGKSQHSSAFLGCTLLTKKIIDPLYYVLQAIVRFLCRLSSSFPDVFEELINFAVNTARATPCGPVSSIVKYLHEAGWALDLSGQASHEDGFCINFRLDNCKKAFHVLQCAWFSHVHAMTCHRKGIPEALPDFWSTRARFCKLDNTQHKLLALNLVGGWQAETTKAKWSAISDSLCPLCGQQDTQRHRFLECPKLCDVRHKHKDACVILDTTRPDWVFHPIAKLPAQHHVYMACIQALTYTPDVQHIADLPMHPRFYTDGACENPTISQYRRASWSVTLDLSKDEEDRAVSLQACTPSQSMPPQFRCAMVGLTKGQQCIARSELFAVVKACELVVFHQHTTGATLYTDSQYVINVVRFLRSGRRLVWHKLANRDLVEQLASLLDQRDFTFVKLKSHRAFSEAVDSEDLWNILGNFLADRAATEALKHVPPEFLALRDEVLRDFHWEVERLDKAYKFMLELNLARVELVSRNSSQVRQAQCVIAHYLDLKQQDFTGVQQTILPELSVEHASCCLQGANLALNIYRWATTLQWPDEQSATSQQKLGITWLELLFNFYIVTGWLPPVRVAGHAVQSQYYPYHSLQSKSLMPSRRTASAMCLVFQNAVQSVESLIGTKLWTKPSKQGAGVLRLAGFFGEAAGIMLRPTMLCVEATINETLSYLESVGSGNYLNLPLPEFSYSPSIVVDPIEEPPSAERYRAWNRKKKRGLL